VSTVATGTAPNIAAGAELLALVDCLGPDPTADCASERSDLVAVVGDDAAERAVGVIATFQMMNRLLDGVGAPVRGRAHFGPIATELGFRLDDIAK